MHALVCEARASIVTFLLSKSLSTSPPLLPRHEFPPFSLKAAKRKHVLSYRRKHFTAIQCLSVYVILRDSGILRAPTSTETFGCGLYGLENSRGIFCSFRKL